MKTNLIFILCLAFFSLACLQTAAVAISDQQLAVSETATLTKVSDVGNATPVITKTPASAIQGESTKCAVVTAIEALNVRRGASETDIVLTWLRNGNVVQVIDQSDGDWWLIQHDLITGYARSKYLRESECAK